MIRRVAQIHLIIVCLLLSQTDIYGALTVQGIDPNRHDRFNNSPSFIGNPYVWAGIGQNAGSAWGTLISPTFVLTTAHGPVSGAVRFYQSNNSGGTFVERTVISGMQVAGTDLYLARLNAPATGITPFPIAVSPNASDFLGQSLFVFGLSGPAVTQANQRLGRNVIDQVIPGFSNPNLVGAGDVFVYDFDNPGGVGADEARVEGGDSGGPSFVLINGQPSLVGIHWFQVLAGGMDFPNGGSGDTLVSSYINQINTSITTLGGSETISTLNIVVVPEPSSLMLAAFAGSFSWVAARRRRVQK